MKIEEMIAGNRADCSGCSACANICPKNAITMTRDDEGFAYPKIDRTLCIKCGKCDATCPALNFKAKTVETLPLTFAATYDNKKILRHSSSGGMFTALSEIVLGSGGIVFGVGFDKNWRVIHTAAKNLDELENLRGSKYVQSQIGDVYRQVKDALKSKKVLFSGVSCQCAGLKSFLGGDHENLLTVDVICHGVPSPALWESYIDELSYAHDIAHVNFRDKRNGWDPVNVSINFSDQSHTFNKISDNFYTRFFMRNLSLRPSCSSCKFRFPNGQSDLSLGDAWGVKNFAPDMFDNRGVSIVFIHTDKGKKFFEQLTLKKKAVDFVDAVKSNKLFITPTPADSRREEFFFNLSESKDWFATMQYYYNQDDTEIRKETGKKIGVAFLKNLEAILAPIRQKSTKNILVVSSLRDKDEQELLMNFFKQNTDNCSLYFLQPKGNGQFVYTENFSGTQFELKDANALSDFVTKYKIASVFLEKPLKFGENTSVIAGWLKACGLPLKLFAQKKS